MLALYLLYFENVHQCANDLNCNTAGRRDCITYYEQLIFTDHQLNVHLSLLLTAVLLTTLSPVILAEENHYSVIHK